MATFTPWAWAASRSNSPLPRNRLDPLSPPAAYLSPLSSCCPSIPSLLQLPIYPLHPSINPLSPPAIHYTSSRPATHLSPFSSSHPPILPSHHSLPLQQHNHPLSYTTLTHPLSPPTTTKLLHSSFATDCTMIVAIATLWPSPCVWVRKRDREREVEQYL